jgi:hypothetical protein
MSHERSERCATFAATASQIFNTPFRHRQWPFAAAWLANRILFMFGKTSLWVRVLPKRNCWVMSWGLRYGQVFVPFPCLSANAQRRL